jgi:hypothetical protein
MAKKKRPELPIVAEIRAMLRQAPFVGLVIHLSDGSKIRVVHQDYIYLAPNGVTVHVYDEEQHPFILNARQIVGVTATRGKKAAS